MNWNLFKNPLCIPVLRDDDVDDDDDDDASTSHSLDSTATSSNNFIANNNKVFIHLQYTILSSYCIAYICIFIWNLFKVSGFVWNIWNIQFCKVENIKNNQRFTCIQEVSYWLSFRRHDFQLNFQHKPNILKKNQKKINAPFSMGLYFRKVHENNFSTNSIVSQ